ncbi:MAG TPA: hypothetical protein VFV64_08430 [Permianibacter sp.]|nr:hypothetical protein [Permianibacter sp.]
MNRSHRVSSPRSGTGRRPAVSVLFALSLALVLPTSQAAEPPAVAPAQPPSVNKPVQRPPTPVQTGPQFVREPVVRPPGQRSPELTRLQQQLQQVDKSLNDLQQKRDSTSELSQQQTLQMQQLMDRKTKLEQQISDLLKQQSDSTQSIIDNTK